MIQTAEELLLKCATTAGGSIVMADIMDEQELQGAKDHGRVFTDRNGYTFAVVDPNWTPEERVKPPEANADGAGEAGPQTEPVPPQPGDVNPGAA